MTASDRLIRPTQGVSILPVFSVWFCNAGMPANMKLMHSGEVTCHA
ncbi:hypothetical protein [Methanogenium sp. MK-MG]|nr:hypothetical protein [Methanogenium sp. MK-MG]